MKRIISLLLTFCLLATMMCLEIPSYADTSEYAYEVDGSGNAVLLRFTNRGVYLWGLFSSVIRLQRRTIFLHKH